MSKKKIFVSFDTENDGAFKNIVVGKSQEKDAKFFIERMFNVLQDSLGTVPAIYTILNSTWFEGH